MRGFAEFACACSGQAIFIRPETVEWFRESNGFVDISSNGDVFTVRSNIGEVCEALTMAELELPKPEEEY